MQQLMLAPSWREYAGDLFLFCFKQWLKKKRL